jgi:hypothetical protein
VWNLISHSEGNKQLRRWHRSSIVLSYQATETTFTGTRTQDTFSGVLPFVPVISQPKQANLFLALFFYSSWISS